MRRLRNCHNRVRSDVWLMQKMYSVCVMQCNEPTPPRVGAQVDGPAVEQQRAHAAHEAALAVELRAQRQAGAELQRAHGLLGGADLVLQRAVHHHAGLLPAGRVQGELSEVRTGLDYEFYYKLKQSKYQ